MIAPVIRGAGRPAWAKASATTRLSLPVVQTASMRVGLVAIACSTTVLVTLAVQLPLTLRTTLRPGDSASPFSRP